MTLAAYECGSVDFPDPPYPDQIVCPQQETDAEQVGVEKVDGMVAIKRSISLLSHVQSWPGSLFVGECLLVVLVVHTVFLNS